MEKSFLRRNLPHLYFPDGRYFITYRLANSLPQEKLTEIETNPTKWDFEKFKRLFTKYDSLLDSGNFSINYLIQRELADICKYTIHYPDGKDYTLICCCIMPNHVHLVFKLLPANKGISKIMQAIKGISANKCNLLLRREGKFWQDESYDRWIRDDKELFFVIRYVLLNPVNTGLVKNWKEWKYTYCHSNYIVL
jgi:REP element-mobilizing transposase RayT